MNAARPHGGSTPRPVPPTTQGTGDQPRGTGLRIGAAPPTHRPSGHTRRVSRTDRLTTVWMLVGLVVAALTIMCRDLLPQPLWTAIHVVTLGVATNAILQWSWYFTRTLLHLPPHDRRAGLHNTVRVVLLNVALVGLVVSMWTGRAEGVVPYASLAGLVGAWHGLDLVLAARTALSGRFRIVISHYAAAGVWFVVACTYAGLVAVAMLHPSAPGWLVARRDDLTLAHALAGVVGWVGLTVSGTLLTLGPTALRTRMAPDATRSAHLALPLWCTGLVVAVAGASLGILALVAFGLGLVAVAVVSGTLLPLAQALMGKGPREYGSWNMMVAAVWLAVGLLAVAANAALAATDASTPMTVTPTRAALLRDLDLPWVPLIGVGGLVQMITGALTYLMPVVIGGGPSVVRLGIRVLETASVLRLAVRNTALGVLALLNVRIDMTVGEGDALGAADAATLLPSLLWGLVLLTLVADVTLLARCGIVQARAAREARSRPRVPTHSTIDTDTQERT